MWQYVALVFLILTFQGCSVNEHADSSRENYLFTRLEESQTGISFANNLKYTEEINPYTFRSFYNGGGVGLGDFNNDGLLDIFFAGNQVSNRLYLNQGNFKFKDVTDKAGLESSGVWSTGVSVVDINGDGWVDIYVCKSGDPKAKRRRNELFLNQGNLTFKESAKEYGLDFIGLSVHASFFDFDKDGDLDCYLLNNSLRSVGIFDFRKDQRKESDSEGGNRLLINENGFFKDVSRIAGIFTSKIGFGLGVAVGDLNNDNWPDIYVANDFFERDYLYLNEGNGKFTESLEESIQELSLGSMGVDMADINNDSRSEIFVSEMLPEDIARLRTTSQFENWNRYMISLENGYHRQFSRNTLQLNNGDGTFSEISRLAGVHATDWSWGGLIFDMDNDGWKDIFVANGIYKDLINQDYVNFIADKNSVRDFLQKGRGVIKRLVDSIPSNKIPNYVFRNNKNLTFTNMASTWGMEQPTHSNGAAYGDFDNDGDIDLVVNNVNMPAYIYRNNSDKLYQDNQTISIKLNGQGLNTEAIGSKVKVYVDGNEYYQEQYPTRGFMSSVDSRLHFGLGPTNKIDSVIITWPNSNQSKFENLQPGSYSFNQSEAIVYSSNKFNTKVVKEIFEETSDILDKVFYHAENDYVDFDKDRLLFIMNSNEGPCLCKGDVNNDNLDDFYVGGAKGQAGVLYMQSNFGFRISKNELFEKHAQSEDIDCILFDANNDGFDDLYVGSGSNEFSSSSLALNDRIYFSNGDGTFRESNQVLPAPNTFENTSTVSASDIDLDGDLDLFVGVRSIPFNYGIPASGYILVNDGNGKFEEKTDQIAPGLRNIGLITKSKWIDVDGDAKSDLIVVGEWMPVTLFVWENGKLVNRTTEYGLEKSNGWYHSIEVEDFNRDGRLDFVVGNHGLNSRFKANENEPLVMYVNDFDRNGTVEQIICTAKDGKHYPWPLRNELLSQMPSLRKSLLHYSDYADKTIDDLFSNEVLRSSDVKFTYTLSSAVYLNFGGKFKNYELPIDAQFSTIYSITSYDFNNDGTTDLFLGGNQHRAKPEIGINAASYGMLLTGKNDGGFTVMSNLELGVSITGEIRSGTILNYKNKNLVIIGKNNDRLQVLNF